MSTYVYRQILGQNLVVHGTRPAFKHIHVDLSTKLKQATVDGMPRTVRVRIL